MEGQVHSKFQYMDINEKIRKFTWKIENFSTIVDKQLYSEDFIVDGNKWRINIYPKGDGVDCLSIFLGVAASATLPSRWSGYAQFGFAIIDQIDRRTSVTQGSNQSALEEDEEWKKSALTSTFATREFRAKDDNWGFLSFLTLNELHDPKRSYLVNDACLVEAYFSTDRTKALISHELIVETDSDKLKTEEAICAKAAIDNQKTTVTKPEELSTPPTQPSCQVEAFEPEEPTDEDMKMFFTSLESELSGSKSVYSQEEAKEALAKVEEALNRTPTHYYYWLKNSAVNIKAFKILASFYCSSTTLTSKQKNVLSTMEESLQELGNRAVKAKRGKDNLTEKESIKLALTHNLDRNVIRYKEVESEAKLIARNLVAPHEQVEEAHKKRENMLAERKGIFRRSTKIKEELEALRKEWAEYEAKAEVAEKEEKTIMAEWTRMKDLISSIKRKI